MKEMYFLGGFSGFSMPLSDVWLYSNELVIPSSEVEVNSIKSDAT